MDHRQERHGSHTFPAKYLYKLSLCHVCMRYACRYAGSINPQRACTARVIVLGLCVCVCVCPLPLFWHHRLQGRQRVIPTALVLHTCKQGFLKSETQKLWCETWAKKPICYWVSLLPHLDQSLPPCTQWKLLIGQVVTLALHMQCYLHIQWKMIDCEHVVVDYSHVFT